MSKTSCCRLTDRYRSASPLNGRCSRSPFERNLESIAVKSGEDDCQSQRNDRHPHDHHKDNTREESERMVGGRGRKRGLRYGLEEKNKPTAVLVPRTCDFVLLQNIIFAQNTCREITVSKSLASAHV